jgi:hypothetical protein
MHREQGKKKTFLPYFSPSSLPPRAQKDADTTHLLATWWKNGGDVPLGRFGAAAQWPPRSLSPPCFSPINTGEMRGKKEKKDNKRGHEWEQNKGRKRERRENTRKERTERGKRSKRERKRKKKTEEGEEEEGEALPATTVPPPQQQHRRR